MYKLKYIFLIIITFIATLYGNIKVIGTVVDKSDQSPIINANIIAGEEGTVTDKHGKFQIQTDSKVLIINHIGFDKVSIQVNDSLYIQMSRSILKNEEIIVLSSLEGEQLINSNSSISIFKQDDIKYFNQNHFQNIIDYIPNLNFVGGTSRPRYFQIRGVGERSQYFGEGSPNFSISYTLDDIDLSGIGMIGGLNDIRQVEVSKGPQSTIFGNNAIGGSISLKTNDPTDSTTFLFHGEIGSDRLNNIAITANLKILEETYLRFNIQKHSQDGFRNNNFLNEKNTNKKDELFLNMKINLTPIKSLNLNNTFIFSEMENGYDAWAPDNNKEFQTYTDQPGEDSQKTLAFSSKAKYSNDRWSLLGIVSHVSTNMVHSYDGDWGNNAFWEDTTTYGFDPYYYGYYSPYQFFDKTDRKRLSTTLETRLILGNSIVGVYSKKLNEKDDARGWLFGGDAAKAVSDYKININAIYAKSHIKINDKVSNSTSYRYENNIIDYYGTSYSYYGDALPEISSKKSFYLVGYKTALRFRINNYTKSYLSLSRGYKSGGVNQQPYISLANRNYDPEYLTNLEIGFKKLSGKNSLNLSGFYGIRSNQQVSISAQQQENDPNSFYYFTENSGEGWSKGFEIEHTIKFSKSIALRYSAGYLDTWIEDFSYEIGNGTIELAGSREAAMSPNISGSMNIFFKKNGYHLTLSQFYNDEYYYSDSHDHKTDAYTIQNISFGRDFEKWRLSFWINNAFDVRYPVRGFYFGLIPPSYEDQLWISYGDPRQIGFTFDYIF